MEHKKEKELHTQESRVPLCSVEHTKLSLLAKKHPGTWNLLSIDATWALGTWERHTFIRRRPGAWAEELGCRLRHLVVPELWVFANSFPILYLQRGGPVVSRRAARSETASAVLAVRYPPSYGGALATLPSAHTMHKNSHTRDSKIKKTYVVSLTVCSTAAVIYLGAQRANKGWARLKRKYGHSMG